MEVPLVFVIVHHWVLPRVQHIQFILSHNLVGQMVESIAAGPRHHNYGRFRVSQDSWKYYSSHTLKIRFCINLASSSRSCKWFLSFYISERIFCAILTPPYVRHLYHPSSFDHPNNTWWRTQITMPVPPAYCCRFFLGASILTDTLVWRILYQ
jgi:hypothetical protein